MSTLKVNAIQSNTTQSINVNSNLGNISNIEVAGVGTFSGGIVVAAGSASAPSISPSGDSNTGIFFPSPDTVCIGEGGSEVIRVNNSGLVGIGSDSPTAPLNVVNNNASTPTVWLRNTSGGGDSPVLRVQGGANNDNVVGTFEVRDYDGNVDFKVGGTGNVTIGTGNLIIGTSGKGIDFSATANSSGTMTSELLSDYEEGTWTPVITGHSGAGTLATGNVSGKYIKIGNIVTYYIDWTNITYTVNPSGVMKITGLPFVTSTTGFGGISGYVSQEGIDIAFTKSAGTLGGGITFRVYSTSTEVAFRVSSSTGWDNYMMGSSTFGVTGGTSWYGMATIIQNTV